MTNLNVEKIESSDEQIMAAVFTLIWTLLVIGGIYVLRNKDLSVTVFEFVILVLAIYRLIRLFVYDKIAQFIRDLFLDKVTKKDKKSGMLKIVRHCPKSGIRRKVTQLVSCPWCTGVWMAMIVLFFHFYCPYAFYVFILLALSGVATFVQLLANIAGKYGH
jgi:hypothetical protein|tara:strand:- start:36 stop:518 length:483 start_codon:yes stop_codon:yes gene_type:complete